MISYKPSLMVPYVVAAALALAACSTGPQKTGPKTAVPPPPTGAEQSGAAGQSGYSSANSGGTYPYGAVQSDQTTTATASTALAPQGTAGSQQARAGGEDEIVVMGPDGTVWVNSNAPSPQYQSDVESCHAYARGQIKHDERIESDVDAAFQSEAGGLGLVALRQRMNHYERGKRLPSLFNSCMVAKGYTRQ